MSTRRLQARRLAAALGGWALAAALAACSPAPAPGPSPVALAVRAGVRGPTLRIDGTSSAPDVAWVVYAAYSAADPERRATGALQVEGGRFSGQVGIAPWPAGEIDVDVDFQMGSPSPRQPQAVIARFGENGERMTGPGVIQGGDSSRVAVASAKAVKP